MNLEIPPYRRASTGAFPSVLQQPVPSTSTAPPGPDGLGIRGLSSEPPAPIPRPGKRRSGNRDTLESDSDTSRARTKSPEVAMARQRSKNGSSKLASGLLNGTSAATSTSALAGTAAGTGANSTTSNKRARSSVSVASSSGNNFDSLASAASDALQTFPIPNPALNGSTPSTMNRDSSAAAATVGGDSQQADSGKRRATVPTKLEPLNKSVNKWREESGNGAGDLAKRRTGGAKALTIATPTHDSIEAAPRTAPAPVSSAQAQAQAQAGKAQGHGRRGASFNGQGQFPAQPYPPISGSGRRASGVGASLPTPLQPIPVSPYNTSTTPVSTASSALYPAPPPYHRTLSSSSQPPLPPILNPSYAPTLSGTSYSIPSQQQRPVSSSSSSATATAMYQARPVSPDPVKSSFLQPFSQFFDSIQETRSLSRSLESQILRSQKMIQPLEEGRFEGFVRSEMDKVAIRLEDLERRCEGEMREWRYRIERIERSLFGSNNVHDDPRSHYDDRKLQNDHRHGLEERRTGGSVVELELGKPGGLMIDEESVSNSGDYENRLPLNARSRPGTASSGSGGRPGTSGSSTGAGIGAVGSAGDVRMSSAEAEK